MIEVQIGTYLGEDDIIRSDDAYHRSADETKQRAVGPRQEACSGYPKFRLQISLSN
jgi:hypothetical protein